MMPSSARQRIRRILRATTLALLSVLFVLFALVQFQQRLLRHRAEKLATDIAYLRDHPGNRQDLQRMQKRWGAFSYYYGPCTPQHCSYHIELFDLYFILEHHNITMSMSLIRLYSLLGGRPAAVHAGLRLTNNQLWGSQFNVITGILPSGSLLDADIYFGPRLSPDDWRRPTNLESFQRGYSIGSRNSCMFCINTWVLLTPYASTADRERLSAINFSCLTRFFQCADIHDIFPGVAAQEEADNKRISSEDVYSNPRCRFPLSMLAREQNSVLAADIFTSKNPGEDRDGSVEYTGIATVTQKLKNAFSFSIGESIRLDEGGLNSRKTATTSAISLPLHPGPYLVFFNSRDTDKPNGISAGPCSIIPDTPAARVETVKGIAQDLSTGENYRDNPSWYLWKRNTTPSED